VIAPFYEGLLSDIEMEKPWMVRRSLISTRDFPIAPLSTTTFKDHMAFLLDAGVRLRAIIPV
jgi:hypothetical protein